MYLFYLKYILKIKLFFIKIIYYYLKLFKIYIKNYIIRMKNVYKYTKKILQFNNFFDLKLWFCVLYNLLSQFAQKIAYYFLSHSTVCTQSSLVRDPSVSLSLALSCCPFQAQPPRPHLAVQIHPRVSLIEIIILVCGIINATR